MLALGVLVHIDSSFYLLAAINSLTRLRLYFLVIVDYVSQLPLLLHILNVELLALPDSPEPIISYIDLGWSVYKYLSDSILGRIQL